MFDRQLHPFLLRVAQQHKLDKDPAFIARLSANATAIRHLFSEIYGQHPQFEAALEKLFRTIVTGAAQRPQQLKHKDEEKAKEGIWFLSHQIAGMSLYVDRFCGTLGQLPQKFDYLQNLGINFLHLMPLFQSPPNESDGGYAVSDFRQVDERFGTLDDLKTAIQAMNERGMYLMLDIVLNHTSHHHEWARKAKQGDPFFQNFYYFFPDRRLPDLFDQTMPDIFPESAPGNFTYVEECQQWVMTVFHRYQWDLNYTNPEVLCAMLDNVLFYANLGVDVLRIDAPAFIWKQLGTNCQNLPQAHTILRLLKLCTEVAAPGMALLGEAIVAPKEIMKYFGTGVFTARECDFAYNATQMALQWDALATGDTRIMIASQPDLLQKPYGTTWITYTRCHDDIGLGYEDAAIEQAGFSPSEHRKFIKDYYSGAVGYSPAKGALFSFDPKTQDARISGTLASLCGIEKALGEQNKEALALAVKRVLLMQAHSFFVGGVPMLFYGDEAGYTNDYSYLDDPGKNYDNRWMHRPLTDWAKNKRTARKGTVEHQIFEATKRLLTIRKSLPAVADHNNLIWLQTHNLHIAGFVRFGQSQKIACLFNFSDQAVQLHWGALLEHGIAQGTEHWQGKHCSVADNNGFLNLGAYGFWLLEAG
jgi:amylosucrase